MNRLVDDHQAGRDAELLAQRAEDAFCGSEDGESEACNYDGVTLQASNGAYGAPRGHSVAPSTVLAKVCTCQIVGNRINSASCPRHGVTV